MHYKRPGIWIVIQFTLISVRVENDILIWRIKCLWELAELLNLVTTPWRITVLFMCTDVWIMFYRTSCFLVPGVAVFFSLLSVTEAVFQATFAYWSKQKALWNCLFWNLNSLLVSSGWLYVHATVCWFVKLNLTLHLAVLVLDFHNFSSIFVCFLHPRFFFACYFSRGSKTRIVIISSRHVLYYELI